MGIHLSVDPVLCKIHLFSFLQQSGVLSITTTGGPQLVIYIFLHHCRIPEYRGDGVFPSAITTGVTEILCLTTTTNGVQDSVSFASRYNRGGSPAIQRNFFPIPTTTTQILSVLHLFTIEVGVLTVKKGYPIEEGRAASKSPHLAIFCLCPRTQFLPILFQIQLLKYFPQKHKEQRHKHLGILISWLPHKFRSLKILGPLSNFKIQQFFVLRPVFLGNQTVYCSQLVLLTALTIQRHIILTRHDITVLH